MNLKNPKMLLLFCMGFLLLITPMIFLGTESTTLSPLSETFESDPSETSETFQEIPKNSKNWPNYLKNFKISLQELEQNLSNENWFLEKILKFSRAITQIENKADLAPGPIANTLFGGLISLVREFPNFNTSHITNDHRLLQIKPMLLEKCSTAEFLLEADFGKQVQSGWKKVEDFLYFENYKLLIQFEIKSIQEYLGSEKNLKDVSKIVLIGSGPLPLTSIQLAENLPGINVTNYDQSEEAVSIGSAMLVLSQLDDRISCNKLSALNITRDDLAGVDVVYLAALVGNNPEDKKKIVDHLFRIMSPGSILVARSAMGLRTLVYHQITKEDFGQFEDFREYHSENKVIINSIVVGRKPGNANNEDVNNANSSEEITIFKFS